MQSINLDVKSYTEGGVAHVNLIINEQDTGVLYLDRAEFDILCKTLQTGAKEAKDVLFEHVEPSEEEFDYDIFED